MIKPTHPLVSLLFVALLFVAGVTPASASPNSVQESNDDFEQLMQQIRDDFAENPLVGTITSHLTKYNAADGSFTDIDYASEQRTDWPPLTHVDRLYDFAFAYTNPSNTYFESDELYDKIVAGLQYWYDRNPYCNNWWYNQIAEPQRLGVLMIQMRTGKKQLPASLEQLTLNRMKSDGGNPASWTGANMIDIALHWVYRACLTADHTLLTQAIGYVFNPLVYTTAEGFQHDNCYFQHGPQLYIGGYGDELLKGVTQVAVYTLGTNYALSQEKVTLLSKFIRETYYRTIRGQHMLFDVLGRGVSRSGATTKTNSSIYAERMMVIDPDHQQEYEDIIKRLNNREPASYGIKPVHTHYFRGDYTLHVRENYTFDVRTVSTRTMRCEYGNGENLKTYFMSDGCNNIVMKGNEYAAIFPVWNWTRIPGITAPQMNIIPMAASDWQTKGTSTFAGGVSDSLYGATAYHYHDEYSNINTTARKGWFFFDDEVVCLGAGITSTASQKINTTINQVFLVNNKAVISENNTVADAELGEFTYDGSLNWVLHNNIGYYFPQGGDVFLDNKQQTGSWYSINTTGASTEFKRNIFTLGFDHGRAPKDATYAYIVVPNKASADEMNAHPISDIEILANTDSVQVVRHKGLGIWQMIFYRAASFRHGELSVVTDKGCALLFRDITQPEVQFHIADPAQTQSQVTLAIKAPSVSEKMKKVVCDFRETGVYAGQSKVYSFNANTEDSPITSIKETELASSSKVKVWPSLINAGESVNLEIEDTDALTGENNSYEIYDIAGMCIDQGKLKDKITSIAFQRPGLYLLHVLIGYYNEELKVLVN